jgi:hypothetical protein
MTVTPDARAAFEQWALRQAGHPRDVQSLVRDVGQADEYVGLLSTDVQGRRVVWKTAPYAGRGRITFPLVTIEAVDAWSVEAPELRARSEHIAICDRCAGEGKTGCTDCAATGKRRCLACGGQRKMYGYAANGARRLLNCTTCRGKGDVDCAHCRRGIATCGGCAGEGRVQKWIELEWWRRAVTTEYPPHVARQFGLDANVTNAAVLRDGDIVADIEKPYRLSASDLGHIPPDWLTRLATPLQPGERVARQHLRIALIRTYSVHYRVGGDEDRVAFAGHRLLAPSSSSAGAFARRASTLRSTFALLCVIEGAMVLLSVARGAFFWSAATLFSILAFGGALGAVYGAIADWTSARKHVTRWLTAAAASLVVCILLVFAALPRHAHVDRSLAGGDLDAAESELRAFGSDASPAEWATLHLARLRAATQVSTALQTLGKIPPTLPQYAIGEAVIDRRILENAVDHGRHGRWMEGADALARLSSRGRRQPESTAAAIGIYVPLARQKLVRADWRDAAETIVTARGFGVPDETLAPLSESIRVAAMKTAAEAKREGNASRRLRLRLAAEETLVSWETSTGNWGTPSLIALRTAMARDVAAVERRRR